MRGWMNAGASYIDPVEIGDVMRAGVIKVDPALAPLPTYLGTLGMTGMTAYFGLFDVAKLQEGETVVVSGAAGAVGSAAGQMAKIRTRPPARVVGIAGGEEKCRWLVEELGFDAAIDYKSLVDGGVSAFPDTLLKLFTGENVGKLVLCIDSD